jgi:glycosyltransferase involved in cell wall biosynthesis
VKLVVHDYSGHPGQVQLSRTLAGLGHTVTHQYCASYTTGRGALELLPDDPPGLRIESLSLGETFARYSPARRIRQEIRYGTMAAAAIRRSAPDVAVLSNIPLLSLLVANRALRRAGIPVVFWQQDVYSAAISSAATRRLGAAGRPIGALAELIERHVARSSAAVVPISNAFVPKLTGWGIRADRIHVVPNWGPIDEVPERPKDNSWAVAHDLLDAPVVLYAGTLGLKHDPQLLVSAAVALHGLAQLVVVSEGLGRDLLERERAARGLDNVTLLDFQPYDVLPDVLGSADVVVAILEPDASQYSVPSKVLTYLCAGRPIVAVIPADNAVADMIVDAQAGVIVPPGDATGFSAALVELLQDQKKMAATGRNARAYAEVTFDALAVARRFELIVEFALGHPLK